VDAIPAHRLVVLLAEPVEVHAEREVLRGREEAGLELLLQEDGVGAQIDVLAARDQLLGETADVGVHQRLAAGDRDDRSAALVHRRQALLDRQVLFQDLGRVLDLAAAGAREIAAEQRLEHEHQRIALPAGKLLPDDIGRHRPHLRQRHAHAR
jgi:hypothetical protein